MDLIKAITDWPVIAQGVAGSAIFWIVLETGQRFTKLIANKVVKDKQTAGWFALAAHASPESQTRDLGRFMSIYGALHYAMKGTIIAVLSAATGGVIDTISSVGYLMSAYFYFRALSFIPHTSSWGTNSERKKVFMDSVRAVMADKTYQAEYGKPSQDQNPKE